ncbi:MAG: hypothetical protein KDE28_21835 [Anaerolineales bacterium]|nr:hypothetical protein [Anaerolineales bacterium]
MSKRKYRQLELFDVDIADPFLEGIIWGAIPLSALSPDERTLFWDYAVSETTPRQKATMAISLILEEMWNSFITLKERLETIGYEFASPPRIVGPIETDHEQTIQRIEASLGKIPLALSLFYKLIGQLDFRMSSRQLAQGGNEQVQWLCTQDPIVIFSLEQLASQVTPSSPTIRFCFSPDEVIKAGSSGGESYHFNLPAPTDKDFLLDPIGMYNVPETFLQHLSRCLRGGGFRGECVLAPDGISILRPVASSKLIDDLTAGLPLWPT